MPNQHLIEEFLKTIIKKFEKRKVYSSFKGNIWGADKANVQLISKFSERIRFLSCVIDIFSKYASLVPLNNKKGITIANAF